MCFASLTLNSPKTIQIMRATLQTWQKHASPLGNDEANLDTFLSTPIRISLGKYFRQSVAHGRGYGWCPRARAVVGISNLIHSPSNSASLSLSDSGPVETVVTKVSSYGGSIQGGCGALHGECVARVECVRRRGQSDGGRRADRARDRGRHLRPHTGKVREGTYDAR